MLSSVTLWFREVNQWQVLRSRVYSTQSPGCWIWKMHPSVPGHWGSGGLAQDTSRKTSCARGTEAGLTVESLLCYLEERRDVCLIYREPAVWGMCEVRVAGLQGSWGEDGNRVQ